MGGPAGRAPREGRALGAPGAAGDAREGSPLAARLGGPDAVAQ